MADNSFKIKNSLVLTPVDLATLSNPQAGDLACDINDSNKIKRYDANSSAWTEVGSGGVGSVDIMFVQDFESASLSTFESPTDVTLSQTDPLHGKVSALLTHDASVNKSFKQIIPVDRKFRGQAMVLDLNVKSAASAGNVTIKITDETGSVDLIASEQLQLSNDVSGRRSSVSFTIPSTCESLSYTITALPEAGSPVTRIDDIVAMLSDVSLLETSVEVPVVTDWVNAGPIVITGTTTNPTKGSIDYDSVRYRQVGQDYEVEYKLLTTTAGTAGSGEYLVSLPSGLQFDDSVVLYTGTLNTTSMYSGGSAAIIGKSAGANSAGADGESYPIAFNSTSFRVWRLNYFVGANSWGSAFFPFTEPQGITITLKFKGKNLLSTTTKTIPLTQSGLVQEADSYVELSGGSISGVGTINNFSISEFVTSNLIYNASTGELIAQKAGVYNLALTASFSSGVASPAIFVNGVSKAHDSSITTAGTGMSVAFSNRLEIGDVITFRNLGTGTFTNARAFVTQQGSLKQLNVSSDQKITIPTSELRFEGASARGTGTEAAIVQFTSLAKLRGDAFTVDNSNGTAITMTKAGKLDISAIVTNNNVASSIGISLNQTVRTSAPTITSEYVSEERIASSAGVVSVSGSVFVKVGDIIRVYSTTAIAANTANNLSLSFQEQDIAVSVTNTLPQFSESDSSVRVDTANGYGSTYTKIRRFQTVRENLGTDVEYSDSATLGAAFTIKSSGIYSISFTDEFTLAANMGITLNASAAQCATNFQSLPNDIRLAGDVTAGANYAACATWSGYLQKDDVIRAHTDGSGVGGLARTLFTISKVGKPNVTGVDVTPFVNVPQPENEEIVLNTYAGYGSTNTKIPYFSSIAKNTNKGILRVENSSVTGNAIIALKNCKVNIIANFPANTVLAGFTKNSTNLTTNINLLLYPERVASTYVAAGDLNQVSNFSWEGELKAGEIVRLHTDGQVPLAATRILMTVNAEALSDQILTAPETFSTDTASLQYASSSQYTLSTLQNAPVGTYITFTYAANTNTRTQTTTRPTQTDADMNVNGMLIYTRAYNAASTAAQPAAFAIQIGKGLKGKSLDLYKSAGKVTAGSLDLLQQSATVLLGVSFKEYNEVTGILYVDAGLNNLTSTTNSTLFFSDLTTQTSGYLVINASKNPALTGLNVLLPRIATLSDVKPSGTSGGSSTAGAYQTRTLNTISDPTSIVTSLSSNQFTLPAGTYYIEASAPCCASNTNKIKIRNITDSSDAILGSAVNNGSPASAFTVAVQSVLAGTITISTSKTFELQHRVTTSRATDGYGTACSFGDDEVYSIVKITKVK